MSQRLSINEEFCNAPVVDERLQRRLSDFAVSAAANPGVSFPRMARSDSELEGMYRFLSNDRVRPEQILEPHLRATYGRAKEFQTVLSIEDTTTLHFDHLDPKDLGYLNTGKAGFFGHFAMLMSPDGSMPLGIGSVETHFRTKAPRKRKPGKGRAPKRSGGEYAKQEHRESDRWLTTMDAVEGRLPPGVSAIHIQDREGDNYRLVAESIMKGRRFVIRLCQRDRAALCPGQDQAQWGRLDELVRGGGDMTTREVPLSRRQAKTAPQANQAHPPRKGRVATLRFAATTIMLRRPRYVKESLPAFITINVVRVHEPNPPQGEEPVEWWLATTEPVDTIEQVLFVVDAYRARWTIEEFNKALKTGCGFERRNLETRAAILNALALFVPIAWQLLAFRDAGRAQPNAPATTVLSARQLQVLRSLTTRPLSDLPTLREALLAVAREGGHLLRNGEPGWQTLGRGLEKLWWAEIGFEAGYRAALAQVANDRGPAEADQ